jgi:hypothetical protein
MDCDDYSICKDDEIKKRNVQISFFVFIFFFVKKQLIEKNKMKKKK